jgi:hypothetical protein
VPYSSEIGRLNPMCFLFLIDQSGSMGRPFGPDSSKSKAQGVADAVNRLLHTLVFRCAKGDHVLDRYYIGVIGYGDQVGLGFVGELAGGVLQPVSQVAAKPLRIERRIKKVDDGAGGLVEQSVTFPVWFEPLADGSTPMCNAFQAAHQVIGEFIEQHRDCFPPIVINITDGEATDGNPESAATALRSLASNDGNVLLFNIHVSESGAKPVLFSAEDHGLPDAYAQMLFRMSSLLPPAMRQQARMAEFRVGESARGFGFNADLVSVISFLDIGTRVDTRVGWTFITEARCYLGGDNWRTMFAGIKGYYEPEKLVGKLFFALPVSAAEDEIPPERRDDARRRRRGRGAFAGAGRGSEAGGEGALTGIKSRFAHSPNRVNFDHPIRLHDSILHAKWRCDHYSHIMSARLADKIRRAS